MQISFFSDDTGSKGHSIKCVDIELYKNVGCPIFEGESGSLFFTDIDLMIKIDNVVKRSVLSGLIFYTSFHDTVKDAKCTQQQKQQHDRSDVFYHHDIHSLSAEFFTVFGSFIYDSFWLNNPTDQNTSANCHNRHQNIVADIVHDVKNLCGSTVRK